MSKYAHVYEYIQFSNLSQSGPLEFGVIQNFKMGQVMKSLGGSFFVNFNFDWSKPFDHVDQLNSNKT